MIRWTNFIAWVLFIDMPILTVATSVRWLVRALAVVHAYTMPNDPRANRR